MTPTQLLADLIRRLFAKTPQAFRYIQIVGLLATTLTKLPDFLVSLGIQVPVAQDPYKTIIMVAGIAMSVTSQLAVSDDSKLKSSINTK